MIKSEETDTKYHSFWHWTPVTVKRVSAVLTRRDGEQEKLTEVWDCTLCPYTRTVITTAPDIPEDWNG